MRFSTWQKRKELTGTPTRRKKPPEAAIHATPAEASDEGDFRSAAMNGTNSVKTL